MPLVSKWAYGLSFQSSEQRNSWLSPYLAIYNGLRSHMALAFRTPSISSDFCGLLNDMVSKYL
jgi:hypothetical protein